MRALHVDLLDEEMIAIAKTEISRMLGIFQHDVMNSSFFKGIQNTVCSYFRGSKQQNSQLKLEQKIFQEIVDCTQLAETYMDPLVDKVIDITIQITKKFGCRHQELHYIHIFAKSLVTTLHEEKQRQWERANSVSTKLDQEATWQEMEDYFDSVSQGIKATELLVKTLSANLQQILPRSISQGGGSKS